MVNKEFNIKFGFLLFGITPIISSMVNVILIIVFSGSFEDSYKSIALISNIVFYLGFLFLFNSIRLMKKELPFKNTKNYFEYTVVYFVLLEIGSLLFIFFKPELASGSTTIQVLQFNASYILLIALIDIIASIFLFAGIYKFTIWFNEQFRDHKTNVMLIIGSMFIIIAGLVFMSSMTQFQSVMANDAYAYYDYLALEALLVSTVPGIMLYTHVIQIVTGVIFYTKMDSILDQ